MLPLLQVPVSRGRTGRPSLRAAFLPRVALGVAVGLTLSGDIAAKTEVDVGLTLAFGYDSNPLRVSVDGAGGGFLDARLDSRLDVALGRGVEFFLDADGLKRFHGSDLSNGDYQRADLQVGLAVSPIRMGRTRLSIALGGLHELRRSTFTDRLTADVYEVPTDPPTVPATMTPIPERFDSNTTGAFLDLRLRPSRRLRLFLETRLEKSNYPEDYSPTTSLEPLDNRSVTLEPGFLYRVNGLLAFQVSLALTDLDFKEKPALDGSGNEVPGTSREYRYADYRVRVRLSPTQQWRVSLGLSSSDREDTFAGYYNFDAWTSFVSMDRRVGKNTRFQAYASLRMLDYDAAVVPGDPNGEIRGNEVFRLIGRFDRKLREHVGLFVEGGTQRTDSRDPIFAYDRDWVLTGIRIRR